jgi:aminoglycoside 6'-N-acetyltransferase I
MLIEPAEERHLAAWAEMRADLWPDGSEADQLLDLKTSYLADNPDLKAFIATDEEGKVAGFAEAAVRHDYVNGCDTSPVLFLEGLYVRPEARRQGVAGRLVKRAADWGREQGCREFASDALLDNIGSHSLHAALGFEETERVVYFRKEL